MKKQAMWSSVISSAVICGGLLGPASPAFADSPVAVDDVSEVLNPQDYTYIDILNNDSLGSPENSVSVKLIDLAGNEVSQVENDGVSCDVGFHEGSGWANCSADQATQAAGGTREFQYVVIVDGVRSNTAKLTVVLPGSFRAHDRDDHVIVPTAQYISASLTEYRGPHSYLCLTKNESGAPCDQEDRTLVIDGQGTWNVVGDESHAEGWIWRRISFTPAEGAVGSSTVYVRDWDYEKNKYSLAKFSVTVDPNRPATALGQPIAIDDAGHGGVIIPVLNNDRPGPRQADLKHVALIDTDGERYDSVIVDGVECHIAGMYNEQIGCVFSETSADRAVFRYVAFDEMRQASEPARLIVGRTATTPLTPCFRDITASNAFGASAYWACETGLSRGWDVPGSDLNEFRPFLNVQRDAAAAFLYRAAGSPEFTPPATSPFHDVAPDDEHYKAITWAADQGITKGWPDGTFRPRESIKRDAFVAFLARFADAPTTLTSEFWDVYSSPFESYIGWAYREGIAQGWPDGTFRPHNAVDRQTAVEFINRMCRVSDKCALDT